MTDVDVSGWQPAWEAAQTQLQLQAVRLGSLREHSIVDAWIVWNLEHDKWFADLPVVLEFDDGRRLEVSWQTFDELSISWNTIDVAVTPLAWVTWPLEWRSQNHPALRNVVGQVVRRVEATQHLVTTRRVDAAADTSSAWMTSGVWLQTTGSGLHLFNALDENGLSNNPPVDGAELRRVTI